MTKFKNITEEEADALSVSRKQWIPIIEAAKISPVLVEDKLSWANRSNLYALGKSRGIKLSIRLAPGGYIVRKAEDADRDN